MDLVGYLGEIFLVGDIKRPKQPGVHLLIPAMALFFHQGLIKVHVNQSLIDLDHPVLETRGNPQFIYFRRQDQTGLGRLGNADAVKLHQDAQAGRDNRTGSGQPHAVRDIGPIPDREVLIVKLNLVLDAVIVKTFNRGLEQTNPAIVAVQIHIADQFLDAPETRLVLLAGKNLQLGALIQQDFHTEVAERERDRLAEKPIRGITHQPGPGI